MIGVENKAVGGVGTDEQRDLGHPNEDRRGDAGHGYAEGSPSAFGDENLGREQKDRQQEVGFDPVVVAEKTKWTEKAYEIARKIGNIWRRWVVPHSETNAQAGTGRSR